MLTLWNKSLTKISNFDTAKKFLVGCLHPIYYKYNIYREVLRDILKFLITYYEKLLYICIKIVFENDHGVCFSCGFDKLSGGLSRTI